MKHLRCLPAILALAVLLTGCGTEISEEQNRIMAEYAADLLLEYDANYQSHLVEIGEEAELPETTENTTEEPAAASDTEEPAATTEAEESAASVSDIAAILGREDLSITYGDCTFVDSYPDGEPEESYVDLNAAEGSKLAVLRFQIQNLSAQEQEVDLLHAQLDYQLLVNGSKHVEPMLTILTEDLGTFQGTIAPEQEQSAVLIFQVSDSWLDEAESLELRITYQEQNYVIHVQ
ncbi:MAG: hypothetical protein NC089_00870 [Bacteroides sp.]|nr:hypothetical protein [Bacteroides sp.]MCM1550497.1 hypothetical protein [Clostridium sp.]